MKRSHKTNSNKKLRVAVLFGGRSAEHEVSLVSATSIINALDRKKYEVVPIGITREGSWFTGPDVLESLKGRTRGKLRSGILLPDPTAGGIVSLGSHKLIVQSIEVVFPVLHGTFGEDGTIQGLLDLAGVAYVGSGMLGSAAAMDKIVAKQLFRQAGLPVVADVWFLSNEFRKTPEKIIGTIEKTLDYPCFVKPANLGSSVGISKARTRKELKSAITLAAKYDRRILVEQAVQNPREIEVSILGNDHPIASVPGEIIPSNEFYDYDAKYVDGKSTSVIPAQLPERVVAKIREYAIRSFMALDCSGMARVDFLVEKKTNRIFLNEVNTIPGFTSISMYPKLWEATGISYKKLLDRLIALALERHSEKHRLRTAYTPKKAWYKG